MQITGTRPNVRVAARRPVNRSQLFPCPGKGHNCSLTMRSPRSSASTQGSWSTKAASPIPTPPSYARPLTSLAPGRVHFGRPARPTRGWPGSRRRCARSIRPAPVLLVMNSRFHRIPAGGARALRLHIHLLLTSRAPVAQGPW